MKITGLWDTDIAWNLHIESKNKFREMIAADPEASGSSIKLLRELIFDDRLAYEKTDKLVLNEAFLYNLTVDYKAVYKSYKPGLIEKQLVDRMINFTLALYRNDSAYFERIGGVITFIVKNHEKFDSMDGDYKEALIKIRDWWDVNDKRDRTRPWIMWVFNFVINKYGRDKFYKKSVNHALYWIHLNARLWKQNPNYHPDYWFGKKKGKQVMELYGGNF